MAESALNSIRKHYPDHIPIEIQIVKEPNDMTIANASGIMWESYFPEYVNAVDFCRIAAETTTGCLLAANALGKRDKSPSEIGRQATEELLKDLSHKACVDRYLEDQVSDFSHRYIPFNAIYTQQLILLMALAKGHSKIRCGPLSDRTKTAIFVVEQLTDVSFLFEEISTIQICSTLGQIQHCWNCILSRYLSFDDYDRMWWNRISTSILTLFPCYFKLAFFQICV